MDSFKQLEKVANANDGRFGTLVAKDIQQAALNKLASIKVMVEADKGDSDV